MKKFFAFILLAVLVLTAASVSADGIKIAVPNDATNEGRALLLLEAYGVIDVDDEAGITATVADIKDNPLGIEFVEVEAAMVPNVLADVDYGIIRSIRGYNLLALIYAVLCMLEMILTASPYSIIWTVIVDVLICVILLIFIPVLEKGVKKWTT